jgi:hypothetical protein
MKSYIKLYGPPVAKALRVLREVAVDMPEVCIMDLGIEALGGHGTMPRMHTAGEDFFPHTSQEYHTILGVEVPEERCDNLISKSGETTGEYDFYFEWFKDPSKEELEMLIEKIDEKLEPMGRITYTITTK